MSLVDMPVAEVACYVIEARRIESAQLRLLIAGPDGVAGLYNIQVRKSDRSGTAELHQAGMFEAKPGAGAVVGRMELGVLPETNLTVDAKVEVRGKTILCRNRREDRL